jgi:hypothetical protein
MSKDPIDAALQPPSPERPPPLPHDQRDRGARAHPTATDGEAWATWCGERLRQTLRVGRLMARSRNLPGLSGGDPDALQKLAATGSPRAALRLVIADAVMEQGIAPHAALVVAEHVVMGDDIKRIRARVSWIADVAASCFPVAARSPTIAQSVLSATRRATIRLDSLRAHLEARLHGEADCRESATAYSGPGREAALPYRLAGGDLPVHLSVQDHEQLAGCLFDAWALLDPISDRIAHAYGAKLGDIGVRTGWSMHAICTGLALCFLPLKEADAWSPYHLLHRGWRFEDHAIDNPRLRQSPSEA